MMRILVHANSKQVLAGSRCADHLAAVTDHDSGQTRFTVIPLPVGVAILKYDAPGRDQSRTGLSQERFRPSRDRPVELLEFRVVESPQQVGSCPQIRVGNLIRWSIVPSRCGREESGPGAQRNHENNLQGNLSINHGGNPVSNAANESCVELAPIQLASAKTKQKTFCLR